MDALEHLGDELGGHTRQGSLHATLLQNLVVATRLQYRHIMFLLVLAYLAAHTHTLGQELHQLVVNLVNLLTHLLDALRRDMFVADNQ